MVSLVEEGFDVVIRAGSTITDSGLIRRRLGRFTLRLVATPDYFKRKGLPLTPEDLIHHDCLRQSSARTGKLHNWPLKTRKSLSIPETMCASTTAPLVQLAEEGMGIACLPPFAVNKLISSGGCLPPMGPSNMTRDHLAYDRAVQKGLQEELLMNIVHLRFGDAPIFLETQQIIANYSYQKNFSGNISGSPWNGPGPSYGIGGAAMVLAPLSPSVIMPLIESGVPIDRLLRLVAGSLGDAENVRNPLNSSEFGTQISRKFLNLIHTLRDLQIADAISIRRVPGEPKTKKKEAVPEKTYLVFKKIGIPELEKKQEEVCKMLNLPAKTQEAEFIYGQKPTGKPQIPMVTRSMLSIFNNIAATIEVPEKAIKEEMTSKTITDNPDKGRSTIVIHCSRIAPPFAFVSIRHDGYSYWISKKDLETKAAFSLLQLINELSVNRNNAGAMVTIPVNGH
ncbi:hypothetical protein RF55_10726 [Lasius niger]|uniref:LysR substrate-binding domain-containing protein n=1 Tax=Lasius niger TaxID=67767 RepID=A0A0J7KH79_LASNI|nr:hypothetical protein RF55_10726 [Lasius niger]